MSARSSAASAAAWSHVGGRRTLSWNEVYGRSTLPALSTGGRPDTPVTLSVGRQVQRQQLLGRIVDHRAGTGDERVRVPSGGERLGRGRGLFDAVGRDLDVQLREEQPTGLAVLDAVEQLSHDAERRRHDTARRCRSARPR